jgi:hypothetical protein
MDNNEIIPGFDDEQDSHLRIQIDILFDLTLGCFLLSRPSGVINRTNLAYCRKQMEKVIEAGYYRIVFSLRELALPNERAMWTYLAEFRKTLKSLRGELVLIEFSPLQWESLRQIDFIEEFITKETPKEAMSFYRDYVTGNWMEEGLQLAIWYYRRFWYWHGKDMGYLPVNLEVCEQIYGIVKKRNYATEDYQAAKKIILGLLDAPFHGGTIMWDVIGAVDQWLADNWKDFSKGSLTLQLHDRFWRPT